MSIDIKQLKIKSQVLVPVSVSLDFIIEGKKRSVTKEMEDWFPVEEILHDEGVVIISVMINCSVEEGSPEIRFIRVPISKIQNIDNTYVSQ